MQVFQESDIAIVAQRTLFTRMSPSQAYCCTTQLFGAHDTLELSLAHIVNHSCVARANPVILNRKRQINYKMTMENINLND